jgi:hypothetical protein
MPVPRIAVRTVVQKRVRFRSSLAAFKDILHVDGYTGFEQLATKKASLSLLAQTKRNTGSKASPKRTETDRLNSHSAAAI